MSLGLLWSLRLPRGVGLPWAILVRWLLVTPMGSVELFIPALTHQPIVTCGPLCPRPA